VIIIKKLIINADDFGLHKSINDGIIKAYQHGCVTSATIVAGGNAFVHAAMLAQHYPGLKIGVHLTLVAWEGLSFNDDDGMSFPSGHTACAFSVATIVADEYRDHPAIPVISYSIATLTGLSRINDNAHWASDVFFGAAIGYFTSKSLLARHPDNKKTWTVRPMTDGTTVGLAVSYHF
jgi:membrane-associated phospholipid phosphatase